MGDFDFNVIQRSVGYLFREGMTFTLTLTALAAAGGIVFGTLLAVIAVVATMSRTVALRFAQQQPQPNVPPAMQSMTSALSWMPFITVIFAAFVPLAATAGYC